MNRIRIEFFFNLKMAVGEFFLFSLTYCYEITVTRLVSFKPHFTVLCCCY